MGKHNSIYQPELPFEQSSQQPPTETASEPPEFIANNPELLEAWKKGDQKAEYILGEGKEGQQLPLPRDAQSETKPKDETASIESSDPERIDYNSPEQREKLRRLASQAILKEALGDTSTGISNRKIELTMRDDGTGRSDDSKRRQWEADRASQREQARKNEGRATNHNSL